MDRAFTNLRSTAVQSANRPVTVSSGQGYPPVSELIHPTSIGSPLALRDLVASVSIEFSTECPPCPFSWAGFSSPLGSHFLVFNSEFIVWHSIGGDFQGLKAEFLRDRFSRRILGKDSSGENLNPLIAGQIEDLPVTCRAIGTEFQNRVWRAIREIPMGCTLTYQSLAERVATKESSRAVASACGKNNLALFIPCHRVVGSGGSLTGFRWGIERKARLLMEERGAHPEGKIQSVLFE